ncbi:MAG: hypothetical protein IIB44_01870 [Candidatus Marinimicrobia bacterium]|nr:hypothetical protein [Candidatus Neomarinimicrobiota bacterium]MCH8069855.1 hypothetical protein [Candidatus Neomarinimicrobiota bacterium]
MFVTKKDLSEMLFKYINRTINLRALVDWAEEMIKEADFEEGSFDLIRNILARIGLADVREFGLTWDDCYDFLHKLGYDIKVELLEV